MLKNIRKCVVCCVVTLVVALVSLGGYKLWDSSHTVNPVDFPGLDVRVCGSDFWFRDRIDDLKTAELLEKSMFSFEVRRAEDLRKRKYKAENQFQGREESGKHRVTFRFRNTGSETVKFRFTAASGNPVIELAPGESRELKFEANGMWYAWLSKLRS